MSRAQRINDLILITNQFQLSHIEIINESQFHNVPKNAETHFKILIVSEHFKGMPLIKRHKLIQDWLKEELNNGLHALTLALYTPEEWEARGKTIQNSPTCKGGHRER